MAPESVVIPIVSSIIGFPILALLVICCLRKRAKLARERDRRRNYDQEHNANAARFVHRLSEYTYVLWNGNSGTVAVSLFQLEGPHPMHSETFSSLSGWATVLKVEQPPIDLL